MRTMIELMEMINEHLKDVGKFNDNWEDLIDDFKKKITPEELEFIKGRKERYLKLENTIGTEQWKYRQMVNEIDEFRLKHPFKNKERSEGIDAIIEKWNVDTENITWV